MCNQAVSLVAAEIERAGIPTVAILFLREIAEKVRPPRALVVPFPHGSALDAPEEPERQQAVLRAAFELLERPVDEVPLIVDYAPG